MSCPRQPADLANHSCVMFSTSTELSDARARIAAAYSPDALQAVGTRLIATLADHFRRVESRDAKVLNWNEPAALVREAKAWLDGASQLVNDGQVTERVIELACITLAR